MKTKISFLFFMSALILAPCSDRPLFAATDYPARPVSLISAFPPGGLLDLPSRTFGAFAEKELGKPFVVITKTGAGGLIAFESGAKADPDGYTLTIGCTNITLSLEGELASGRNPGFTIHDYLTIGSFVMDPPIVVVPVNSPWKTLADMIKDWKAKPGHYAFSSGGIFSMGHVPGEILARAAGAKVRHVPYKGGGPALAALVGENVDFANQYPTSSIPLIRGKKLRALAVQSDRRLRALPDVPTVKELGVDAEFYSWIGILAPKGTPAPVVEKLREVLAKGVKDKQFITAIETQGGEVRYMSGNELAKYWELEEAKVRKVMIEIVKESPVK